MAQDDDPFAELKTTGALILLMAAVIAGGIGIVQWGSGSTMTAMLVCIASAIGFMISMALFMLEGQREERAAAKLPFPSWLRNEADA